MSCFQPLPAPPQPKPMALLPLCPLVHCQSLPREMVMSHTMEPSAFDTIWLPAEPADVPEAPVLET